MIDVYNLINSEAIGSHCRNIKHRFNTLETGILIHRCKTISLEKKIEYYTEIINNPTLYPNKIIKNAIHFEKKINAINLIKKEIDRLKFNLDLFYKPEKDAIFTLDVKTTDFGGEWFDSRYTFRTLQDAIYYIENNVITDKISLEYKLSKKYLNRENYVHITLTYKINDKNQFELSDIQNDFCGKDDYRIIGNLWMNVPTPFKKGDIITDGETKAVIKWMCDKEKDVIIRGEKGHYDYSDMHYYCYVIDYHKRDNRNVYLENMSNYDEFEYYTKELKGFDRILKAISSLITNEIDISLFLDAYNYIKAEDTVKEERHNFDLYTDEGLKMAGINKKERR